MKFLLFCALLGFTCCFKPDVKKYTPDWPSLDSRPLPVWYDDAKIGIFIHWGVFSVPAIGGNGGTGEWFWEGWKMKNNPLYIDFMNRTQKPGFTYQDFARDFTAEFFDPDEWVKLFEEAGAKYVVLTTKHHEGYTLWPSKYSFSWNSVDVGPNRDIIKDFSNSVRNKSKMRLGLYYSLYEWFNRHYQSDKANNFTTQEFVKLKIMPEVKELLELYQPDILWSDGEWEAPGDYWNARNFLAWLYNEAPNHKTIVTNDRWGKETRNAHGDFFTGDDHFNPGILQTHKFENCIPVDKHSWGYRENALLEDYMTIEELIKEVVMTISCNGNVLINVGPTRRGVIHPIFVERLRALGRWLKVNGEALYSSSPWIHQNETDIIWYTSNTRKDLDRIHVFVTILEYPFEMNSVSLKFISPYVDDLTRVKLLGYNGKIEYKNENSAFTIRFPAKLEVDKAELTIAWTFKIDIPAGP